MIFYLFCGNVEGGDTRWLKANFCPFAARNVFNVTQKSHIERASNGNGKSNGIE